jgi:HAD superfamily hydrolase (TIGR01509 family)
VPSPEAHRGALVLPGPYVAVVFDMDGLLVDSEPLWAEAEGELFARHGHVYTGEDAAGTHGRSVEDTIHVYTAKLGVVEPAVIEAELLGLMRVRYEAGAPLMPGARELVEGLRGRVPLGVASNTNGWLVRLALEGLGLLDAFGAVVSGADIGSPKPRPDAYLEACRLLGVEPRRTLAFEDSPAGVRSARAAGLTVVGVPERDGIATELVAAGAHQVIDSLVAVTVSPA